MKKFLLASAIVFSAIMTCDAQKVTPYRTDSIACITNISLMDDYFKQGSFSDAITPWRWVFNNCPAAVKRTYQDGAILFEKFINDERVEATKQKYVDTLMLVYDQRVKYFAEEGIVLGIKGLSLYKYAPSKKEEIGHILKKSIEIEGAKSKPDVLNNYFQLHTELYGEKKITKEEMLAIYVQVSDIIEVNLTGADGANYNRTQTNADTYFNSFTSCEELITIYTPRLKATPGDVALLRKIVTLFSKKNCNEALIYLEAAEQLYRIEPGSKSAQSLARIYAAKGQVTKASGFLNDAVELESDHIKKAMLLIESADFQMRTIGNNPQARTLALRAVTLRPDWGRPWILIGDIYCSSTLTCTDEFNGASVFWAATDKYLKAKSIDPSVSEEVIEKIETSNKQFPKQKEVFSKGMKAGESYTVKCWIHETTTIRIRQ